MTSSPVSERVRPGPPDSRFRGLWPALGCAAAGVVMFQWFGNANHGYINTDSLFWWWIFQWLNPASETEHGWLILGIAGWLGWRNLRNGQKLRAESAELRALDWNAIAALLAGLALHVIGFAAQQARVSIVALLFFAWGVLRLGGGPRWGRAAAFPLAFMVFAMPISVLDSLGFWLRMWVIDASTWLAHAAHIGVVQNGTQLVAPDGRYNYDVAAACSGVRSLMALAALSLLIGYIQFVSWWRRAVVFLLCFPLVYIGNVARISAIVFAAQAGGARWGDWAHTVMGYAIFAVVLGGVLAAGALLRRLAPEDFTVADVGEVPPPREIAGAMPLRGEGTPPTSEPAKAGRDERPASPYLVAAVVIVCAMTELWLLHAIKVRPPRGETGVLLAADGKNPVELPAFLGREWIGWPAPVTAIEREILPPDTGFSRVNYLASRGSQHVFLSIVLSGRDRTSIHRPELCLVGQGWTLTGRSAHRFAYPGRGDASFPATILNVRREQANGRDPASAPQLVAYWFVGGDRVVASHWSRIAYDSYNRVAHGGVDRWAYVLLQTDAADGEEAALARMQTVLNATLPSFQKVFAPQNSK